MLYNGKFYETRHQDTLPSAEIILSIIQEVIPNVRSAVDLGCGVGTWLSVLRARGVNDICGVDGLWVNRAYLKIPQDCFVQHDLTKSLYLRRTFDLALCLEVAEHLPHECARELVLSLTRLSNFVLFSAAFPYSGGIGHVNEQWGHYWIQLFRERHYTPLDCIRRYTWDNPRVKGWYSSNALLFVQDGQLPNLSIAARLRDFTPPEVYLYPFARAIKPGIKQSVKLILKAIQHRRERSHSHDSLPEGRCRGDSNERGIGK